PTATVIPPFETEHVEERAANLAGVRGVGEGGTLGPAAVLANAVADALATLGVEPDELPLSPGRLWRACAGALRRCPRRLGPCLPSRRPCATVPSKSILEVQQGRRCGFDSGAPEVRWPSRGRARSAMAGTPRASRCARRRAHSSCWTAAREPT